MRIVQVGLPNSAYWNQLAKSALEEPHRQAIRRALEDGSLARVLVYGSNHQTGAIARDILGDRFVGYVNNDTLDPGMRVFFDAVVLGVSPRGYKQALARLESTFPGREFAAVALFEDDPDVRRDSKGRRVPVEPCFQDHVLIRFNGEVFPCCQVYADQGKAVCNIRDTDVVEALRRFDMDCSCAGKGFRPLLESEPLAINTVICELSLGCNARCAMCCTHSPEYTEEYGRSLAYVLDYEAIERALQALRPRYVNLQGGEVLIDPVSMEWIRGLRQRQPSLHLTLVTNGNAERSLADAAFQLFDYFIVDFYGFQPFTYQTITGLPLERTRAFAERLLELDRKRVTLKYLSTPINFHESPLFLEWALTQRPDEIAVIDADSDWYIQHDPLIQIPKFDPYGSTDLLPDIYWSRIISRTVDRLRRMVRNKASYRAEDGVRLLFWGGLFYKYRISA